VAARQLGRKSGGLQGVAGNAGEGLQSKTSTNLRSRKRIIPTDELDQRIIDTAVRQRRTRLRASVKAKDAGHFKHKLSQ